MPAGAGQASVRAAAGLARHAGPSRADRRVLRAPRRVAVVRPQRAQRPALPVSRLEIRPHRPVHRGAVGAGRERLLPEDQAEVLSADRARRDSVGLYGAAGIAAAVPGVRMGDAAGRRIATTPSGCRSATTCRRWRAASIPATCRSCTPATCTAIRCIATPRARTTRPTRSRSSRSSNRPAGCSSRRGATPRRAITTGASPSGSCPGTRWCRPTATTRSTPTPGCRSTTRTASPGPSPIIRRGRCRTWSST